jgi:hypothetical protein
VVRRGRISLSSLPQPALSRLDHTPSLTSRARQAQVSSDMVVDTPPPSGDESASRHARSQPHPAEHNLLSSLAQLGSRGRSSPSAAPPVAESHTESQPPPPRRAQRAKATAAFPGPSRASPSVTPPARPPPAPTATATATAAAATTAEQRVWVGAVHAREEQTATAATPLPARSTVASSAASPAAASPAAARTHLEQVRAHTATRVHARAGFNRVEGNRRASRNGRVRRSPTRNT